MPLAEAGQGVPFRIHPDPVAVIGATEGEELALVLDAARALVGDSLFVMESDSRRISVFSFEGDLIR